MNKKSQITLFIIVGLVMLMMAGIILYIANETKTRKEELFTDSAPITKYVNECLKRYTDQGISHASLQSGYIFRSQGGSIKDFTSQETGLYVDYGGKKVAYLMRTIPSEASYPWENFPYTIIGTRSFYHPTSISFMPTKRQIEKEIEFYISGKMKSNECLNFERDFKGYEIKSENPKAQVSISKEKITAKLSMKVDATDKATGTQYTLSKFQTTKLTRFGEVYDAAKKLIDYDSQYIDFQIDKISNTNGITAGLTRDVKGKDSVITLSDQNGAQIVFARQNRRPALYKITSPTTLATIEAIDPDEDRLENNRLSISYAPATKTVTVTDGQYYDSQTGVDLN